ncbi:MAG: hypothetical protein CVT77_14075 [Alphaproteobacteria bacterium HGW-Alphaproteobacteria-16]|nr:MAG: hypothetical protein CVT77_14075 [Alphaproteobacteria bacterium HGW-Alphaproteobacteria-16]
MAWWKITFDPNSGRPMAPIWWRIVPYFAGYALLNAVLCALLAAEGMRLGHPAISASAMIAAALALLLALCAKRRMKREQRVFNALVTDYESAIFG